MLVTLNFTNQSRYRKAACRLLITIFELQGKPSANAVPSRIPTFHSQLWQEETVRHMNALTSFRAKKYFQNILQALLPATKTIVSLDCKQLLRVLAFLLEASLRQHPHYIELQYVLSEVYFQSHQLDKSAAILLQLTGNIEYGPFFTYKYARSLYHLHRRDEALEWLTIAIQVESSRPVHIEKTLLSHMHVLKAWIHTANKQIAEVNQQFQLAVLEMEKGKQYQFVFKNNINILIVCGLLRLALQAVENFISFFPEEGILGEMAIIAYQNLNQALFIETMHKISLLDKTKQKSSSLVASQMLKGQMTKIRQQSAYATTKKDLKLSLELYFYMKLFVKTCFSSGKYRQCLYWLSQCQLAFQYNALRYEISKAMPLIGLGEDERALEIVVRFEKQVKIDLKAWMSYVRVCILLERRGIAIQTCNMLLDKFELSVKKMVEVRMFKMISLQLEGRIDEFIQLYFGITETIIKEKDYYEKQPSNSFCFMQLCCLQCYGSKHKLDFKAVSGILETSYWNNQHNDSLRSYKLTSIFRKSSDANYCCYIYI